MSINYYISFTCTAHPGSLLWANCQRFTFSHLYISWWLSLSLRSFHIRRCKIDSYNRNRVIIIRDALSNMLNCIRAYARWMKRKTNTKMNITWNESKSKKWENANVHSGINAFRTMGGPAKCKWRAKKNSNRWKEYEKWRWMQILWAANKWIEKACARGVQRFPQDSSFAVFNCKLSCPNSASFAYFWFVHSSRHLYYYYTLRSLYYLRE